jgi:serralysin
VVDDTVQLTKTIFTGLAGNQLAASAFVIGAGASTIDHRIIYNSANGALLFDSDGSGASTAIQFATLAPGLALTAADFVLV